jgi:hypothetical protein
MHGFSDSINLNSSFRCRVAKPGNRDRGIWILDAAREGALANDGAHWLFELSSVIFSFVPT